MNCCVGKSSKYLGLFMSKSKRKEKMEKIVSQYVHDDEQYQKVMHLLEEALQNGLAKSTNASADVKMFPTYVRSLPNGTEKGHYLALDLGGTNFRVLLITLKGQEAEMQNKIFPIPHNIMVGLGTQLFDHIAACIADFMEEYKIPKSQRLALGFTFSFPCKQEGLNVGRLVRWTKGFKCEGVEGHDVVHLLDDAIKRRQDLNIECVAILNDTVGCLMSCSFVDHNTQLGVILGTGTNACYMERLDRVELWDRDQLEPKQVIINTEWGAFGENGALNFMLTAVDEAIDKESLNPGKQIFEKLISGMYMGEIARRILVECAQQKLLFHGELSEELQTPDKFYTKYLSEIEDDAEGSGYPKTRQVLEEIGIESPTIDDCKNVHDICTAVSTRAANLAAAGIAVLLNRVSKPEVTVAVDGSLYRYHPHFKRRMEEKIQQLVNPGLNFKLALSVDGSGRGAAVVAAVAYRLKFESRNNLLEMNSS